MEPRCARCKGSGWIVCTRSGEYAGPGPLPEYVGGSRWHDARCDECGGSGLDCDAIDAADRETEETASLMTHMQDRGELS